MRLTRHLWVWIFAALLQACASAPGGPTLPPAVPAEGPVAAVPAEAVPDASPSRSPEPADAAIDASSALPFDGETREVEDPLRGVTTIDRTVPPDDLWERIRQGFAIPDLKGELVRKKTAQYAASTEYLQRILDRSRLYLHHIVEEIEKRGLPTEIALLPMVESAFNPMAYSRAHASGLWQFIPGTGRRYDLEQNWWHDERRHILESTKAALDYLTYLYEMHGDWHLALASYNWGEGSVKRAVARNRAARKATDYASLKMPSETRNYIPKLQALKNIINDPEPYGIDLDPIPNEPYFAVLDKTPDIDVLVAARLAEMPVEDFVALNPSFSRPLIRAAGAARIILPAHKVDAFRQNLAQSDEKSLVSWQIYHPRRGEKLGTIAKKYKLDIADLKRVNGIAPGSWSVPRVMVVPLNDGVKSIVVAPPIMYAPPAPHAGSVHVVRRGDTLSSIAARFRVSVSQLKRLNPAASVLQIGQRIRVR